MLVRALLIRAVLLIGIVTLIRVGALRLPAVLIFGRHYRIGGKVDRVPSERARDAAIKPVHVGEEMDLTLIVDLGREVGHMNRNNAVELDLIRDAGLDHLADLAWRVALVAA